ncbi:MAG: hypothetical protein ACR2FY_10140 [Pirellulaceae bacterium]
MLPHGLDSSFYHGKRNVAASRLDGEFTSRVPKEQSSDGGGFSKSLAQEV